MRFPALRALLPALLVIVACDGCPGRSSGPSAGSSTRAPTGAASAITVTMAYGSEKKTWLEEQLRGFAASNPRTAAGHPVRVEARAMGSGEAQQAILSGDFRPVVYSPASGAYVTLLNEAWLRQPGRTTPVSPPDGAVVRNLFSMWSRIVPRNP
jgi:Ca-activated chloride channel family protein